jgi:hypothetical protein
VSTTDHSVRAAAIVDDLIARSDGDLGPEDRDSLRVIIGIAFEVQDFLASSRDNAEARDWTQDTVFSGCDSIFLARSSWHILGRAGAFAEPVPGADTFPSDMNDLAGRLDDALRLLQDESLAWPARVLAVNRIARLQLVFLGATLW